LIVVFSALDAVSIMVQSDAYSAGAKLVADYDRISEENWRRYGTDIGRIGKKLLADRYDDRTHFIYELLQNAEDALAKRGPWKGRRSIRFELGDDELRVRHFGAPFDERDVAAICSIAESTKGARSIGRHGIGFKAAYTFTDCPGIHSGAEDFIVENYVHPRRADRKAREDEETLISLPFRPQDKTAKQEITEGFKRLGPSALLFLKQIDEINWSVDGGASGVFLRSDPEVLGPAVERVTVIGQESGQPEIDQNWLVLRREVFSEEQVPAGFVEIAFSLKPVKGTPDRWSVQSVAASPLVVFFPTVVSTNLGFLIQGPYETTPSRDNIPKADPWNQHLVQETAGLLVAAMRWLRDNNMLDASALQCLPIDRDKFPPGSMFAPLFDAVSQALTQEELLPCHGGGYSRAALVKISRTQELRELFASEQVSEVFAIKASSWITGDVTQDKTPELRQYLMRELGILEVTPVTLIPRLTRQFLEAQPDLWIQRFYEFLSGQEAALRKHLATVPLIRLSNGQHVVPFENGRPKAFLPSSVATGFPTIRREVCATAEVRNFFISLGITEPDPVDDVVWNVLPNYRKNTVQLGNYKADMQRILAAFGTDSKAQQDKLIIALREANFVVVVHPGEEQIFVAKPDGIYIATDRLKQLFEGVRPVLIVNDAYECLRGESVRILLEACGSLRYPRPIEDGNTLTSGERQYLRQEAGHEIATRGSERVEDWKLFGFDELLELLPKLEREDAAKRARLIWESLGDLEERRGRGVFEGVYSWTHYGTYRKNFPAYFVRRLNEASWVPDENGDLNPPSFVLFDTLGWKSNPFLQSKILFKAPVIDQLAAEAGFDPAMLDLLKRMGITTREDLTSRFGIADSPLENEQTAETETKGGGTGAPENGDVYDDARDLYGDDMPDIPPGSLDPDGGDPMTKRCAAGGGPSQAGAGGNTDGNSTGSGRSGGGNRTGSSNGSGGGHTGQGKRAPGGAGGRPFISYVGAHPDEEESDPDGLDQAMRMRIEEKAIELIIAGEPDLHRTPEGNPGFDLYETDDSGKAIRWIEVKAMTGGLQDRPVGLSHTQFDFARQKATAFWLYVVERATDPENARVLKIQDPAGHARTFTFDHGWSEIAQAELPSLVT